MKSADDDILGYDRGSAAQGAITDEFGGPGRATVEEVLKDGSVLVRTSAGARFVCCETALPPGERRLRPGAVVVAIPPDTAGGSGVILALIHDLRARHEGEDDADTTPNSLVLEARDELVLKVGDGSITIRKDGKILIKGQDLVSHARRMNRIRGGAVSIN